MYPNAPLVLVAAEIRHPDAGPLSDQQQRQLKANLSEDVPLLKPIARQSGVVLNVSPGPAPIAPTPASSSPRLLSRDQSTSVTFHQDALVVETTRYPGFEGFLALVLKSVAARRNVGDLDGVERIGLRYIDEVRAPGVTDASSWSHWIRPALLGPNGLSSQVEMTNEAWQGVAVYSGPLAVSDDFATMAMVLRYGVGDGYAVATAGDLRRATPPPGPFFLIDIDSYWGPASAGIPALELRELAAVLEGLHAPIRVLFENAITDHLRDEVLRDHDA